MNRPFPAFAALLALLALAMFAVSSSNRSTTVQSVPFQSVHFQPVPVHRSKSTLENAPQGQSNFVFVVPAPWHVDDDDSSAASSHLTTIVCVEAPVYDIEFKTTGRPALTGAIIGVAELVPERRWPTFELDCRSHYDSSYDEIVYGKTTVEAQMVAHAAMESTATLPAAEVMSLFRDFSRSAVDTARVRKAKLWEPLAGFALSRLANHLSAMQAWIRYYVYSFAHELGIAQGAARLQSHSLAWSEYAELMDDALGPNSTAQREQVVQFGDWLWRSAALSWDRMTQSVLRSSSDPVGLLFTAAD